MRGKILSAILIAVFASAHPNPTLGAAPCYRFRFLSSLTPEPGSLNSQDTSTSSKTVTYESSPSSQSFASLRLLFDQPAHCNVHHHCASSSSSNSSSNTCETTDWDIDGEIGAIIILGVAAVCLIGLIGYGTYLGCKALKQMQKDKQVAKLLAVIADAYPLAPEATAYFTSSNATAQEQSAYQAMLANRGKALTRMHEHLKNWHLKAPFTPPWQGSIDDLAKLLRDANQSGALCTSSKGREKYYGYHEIKELILRGRLKPSMLSS